MESLRKLKKAFTMTDEEKKKLRDAWKSRQMRKKALKSAKTVKEKMKAQTQQFVK